MFDRRHEPIVVMGHRVVNGRLAVSGEVKLPTREVYTLFELARNPLSP